MSKFLYNLTVMACFLIGGRDVWAFEVPGYIKDPQKVSDNICVIIKQNTPVRSDAAAAISTSEATNKIINEYAARLYADALSIRAEMIGNSGNLAMAEDLAGKLLGGSKDKKAVLQNEVKDKVKNIALRVKQIVELEAAIVNLQGARMLAAMDEISCDDDTNTDATETTSGGETKE